MKSDVGLADAGDMDTDTLAPSESDLAGSPDGDSAVAVLEPPPVGTDDTPAEDVPASSAVPSVGEPVGAPAAPLPGAEPRPATDPTLAAELQTLVDAGRPRSVVRLLAGLPWTAFVALLAIVDVPFGFLGPRIKSLMGALAISTALMAAGVWLYGPRLAPMLHASAPAVVTPQPPAPAAPAVPASSH